MTALELNTLLSHERDSARSICDEKGTQDPSCRVAWDVVEELLSVRSTREAQRKSSFERYCLDHPDALECRIDDN